MGDLANKGVLLFFPLLRHLRAEVGNGLVPPVSLPDNSYRVVFHPLLASIHQSPNAQPLILTKPSFKMRELPNPLLTIGKDLTEHLPGVFTGVVVSRGKVSVSRG